MSESSPAVAWSCARLYPGVEVVRGGKQGRGRILEAPFPLNAGFRAVRPLQLQVLTGNGEFQRCRQESSSLTFTRSHPRFEGSGNPDLSVGGR